MSIFSKLRDKIFGKKTDSVPTPPLKPIDISVIDTIPVPPPPTPLVDVEAVLAGMAKANPQKLNWRTSIVDLMKLLGMESSLAERRELADELGFTGDKKDTATMNMWLHKQVMRKFAENGGTVPADLLD